MKDYSDQLTEERLARLERRIAKVYREAWDDLGKTVMDYFAKFEKRDAEMRRLVEAEEFSKEEYKRWRLTQMGRGERFDALAVKMAQRYTNANEVALSYVNDMTPGIYSLNRNYEAYQIERTVGNCDFTLFDESTVRRLIVEQPDVMPYYPPKRALKRGIDLAYGKSQITKHVTSGILRGLSPGKIASELMQAVTGMSRESALRAARTGVTAAQNAGRMDSYGAAQKLGIHIRRRWIAAKDTSTRTAHGLADGQIVDSVDAPFVVDGEKLMFPGDTSLGASGHNIYNCRCRMRTVERDGIEAEPRQMRVRNPVTGQYELVSEMTYQEWAEWKQAVEIPAESAIMKESHRDREETAVHQITRLNTELYRCVSEQIATDEVIITDERIQHIRDHHPNDFEQYVQYMSDMIADPDYIIEANKPNTAVLLKEYIRDDEKFKLILRIKTETDPKEYKNSVISFWKIGDTTWRKNLKNKKILYKRV